MNCYFCEGKGWVWEKGMDISEDCSWCKGTGKVEEESKEDSMKTLSPVFDFLDSVSIFYYLVFFVCVYLLCIFIEKKLS